VLNDVGNDEKQYPRRNHCQTTIERVAEIKVMPLHEAPNAK
jgi:hypothetical protein